MTSTKEETKPKPNVQQKWTNNNGNGTITINALDVFHMPLISTLANEYYTSHKVNHEFSKLDPGQQVTAFLSSLMDYSNDAKTIAISSTRSHRDIAKFVRDEEESWSPSVRSSGEPLDDLQQKNAKKKVNVPASPIITPLKKKVQTFTKAPSPPTVPEISTIEGCYLIFDCASGGTLTLQYSKTVVEGAIGFWAPGKGKKLQGFKFTQKQGRSDLMTGIAGKDYKKKYLNGWCQFVKAANKHNGSVCKWSEHERIEVDMYVYSNDRCEVKKIEDGELFDVSNIDAVACLPKGNCTFDGVKTGEYGTFLNRGDAAGASMSIQ